MTALPEVPAPARERTLVWRLAAPLAVAGARLRGRPGRALLVVAGVAATAAMLLAVVGGSLVAQDRTLQGAVASLPTGQRTFRIDSFGLPIGASYAGVDRTARRALDLLTRKPPYVVTSFSTLIVAGELIRLAGVDGLPRVARLVAGRWPRVCNPRRCEVVQVGAQGRPLLSEGAIRLVRVGIVRLVAGAALGASLSTSPTAAQPQRPVLLLTDGAGAFERLPAFVPFYRTYSWIAPLDPRQFHIWQVRDLLRRESDVQAALAQDSATYQLTGPDQVLLSAQQEASVAGQRIVLVGGELSALLLGFSFVAAVGLRRGIHNESRRLSQRGARSWQLWLARSAEVLPMTLGGTIAGLVIAVGATVLIAGAASLPVGAVLGHSIVTWLALGVLAGVWLAATLVILAAASRRPRAARGLRLVDVAAIGAALAALVGLTSAHAGADTASSSSGDRILLALLPGLICFAAAVLAGRALAPLTRVGERSARRAPAALQLALLALGRAQARTLATVGFLIVSIGLALFAASYGATLAQGAHDEAAYAVPLDFTLTEGTQLVLPLQASTIDGYEALAPGVRAYPVLRRTANVAGSGTAVLSPTVLGLSPAAIGRLHWRSDYSRLSQQTIARRIGADGPASLRGVPVPAGARRLSMTVGVRGVPVMFDLVVESRSGRLSLVYLGERPAGVSQLHALVPARVVAVIGLEVQQQALDAFGSTHRAAEGPIAIAPTGTSVLGPLLASGPGRSPLQLTAWSGWRAVGGSLDPTQRSPRLAYAFNQGQTVFVRLPQATDGHPLPVVVSPNIAAAAPAGGGITLDFQDAQVPATIVGVASRFPASEDLGQGFVVAEESRLATALDASAPGTATPDELWLSVPARAQGQVERSLRRQPFATLELASRRDLQRQLSTQPLAHGIILTLAGAGVIALLLAAIGFWVTLMSDTRDERGELFDLEAQGVTPATLGRQLRVRALLLLGFGAAGGLLLGLVLSRLVVSAISVSAETTAPDPPLRYEPAWLTDALALVLLAAVLVVLTELTLRHALRGEAPARGSWSLE